MIAKLRSTSKGQIDLKLKVSEWKWPTISFFQASSHVSEWLDCHFFFEQRSHQIFLIYSISKIIFTAILKLSTYFWAFSFASFLFVVLLISLIKAKWWMIFGSFKKASIINKVWEQVDEELLINPFALCLKLKFRLCHSFHFFISFFFHS